MKNENSKISNDHKNKISKKRNHKSKISNTKKSSKEVVFSENWIKFLETCKKTEKDKKNFKKITENGHEFKRKQKRKRENSISISNENESFEKPNKIIKSDVSSDSSLTCESIVENAPHTKFIAMDCEMVGVGIDAKENVLARVSLVNSKYQCIYDTFVKPKEKIIDYRTRFSGIRPHNLKDAPSYETVQKEVSDILKDKVIVGHALQNDLKVLMLSHSRRQTRDTQKYKLLQQVLKTKKPALRKLVAAVLNETIQEGEHSSIIDARATMMLYQKHKKEWEKSIYTKNIEKPKVEIYTGKEDQKRKKLNVWKKRKMKFKKRDQ